MGVRNGVRSLIMAGLILYMSIALSRFILFITFVTLFSFVCCSANGGWWVCSFMSSFSRSSSLSRLGIVFAVLCPMVM